MSNLPLYLKPSQVQNDLGISSKTLRDLKDTVFIKGKHYFIPNGLKYALWSSNALISWIENNNEDEVSCLVDDILGNK